MLSFEGQYPCSAKEYERHFSERLCPDEIQPHTIHNLMLRYRNPKKAGTEAMSLPIHCSEKPERQHLQGLWLLRFCLVDEDGRAYSSNWNFYLDDSGTTQQTPFFVKEFPHIKQGYVKPYKDNGEGDFLSVAIPSFSAVKAIRQALTV